MEWVSVAGPRGLRQLLDAVMTIGADLDLRTVMERIVEAATRLVDARYGALGVLDPSGTSLSEFVTVGIDDVTRAVIGELPKGHGILGLLIAEPRPLRLPDLNEHPESFGFPPGHPPMRSFLGVPVMVRGAVFGNLYLTDKRSGEVFTDVDEELVVRLATAAGVAIEHARLHARLSELALLEERERIAMDLHDTVIQQLFAVGLSLQALLRRTADADLAGRIERAVQDLDETIRQIRTTIFSLDNPIAALGGVRERMLALVAEAGHNLPSTPRVQFEGPVDAAIDEPTADELVTVLREALSNVARHAEADQVQILLSVDNDAVSLVVRDDGVGPSGPDGGRVGRGLRNLALRAERLGGSFELLPAEGGGAAQVWRIPRT